MTPVGIVENVATPHIAADQRCEFGSNWVVQTARADGVFGEVTKNTPHRHTDIFVILYTEKDHGSHPCGIISPAMSHPHGK